MIRNVRLNLFAVTIVLICVGVVMIYSASGMYAQDRYKDQFYFLKRHLSFVAIGLGLSFAIMCMDYRRFRQYAKPMLVLAFILLLLVLIPGIGREVSGARRWFRFKFLSFQPSEFANLAVLVYMADFIARKREQLKSFWQGFLPPMIILGGVVLLILLQPDLGTSISLGAVVMIMLFVAGVRVTYLASLALASVPLLLALIMSAPYRRARILAFINPWADAKGSGFQIIQSQVALGSGGLWGVGLGHSKQKLFYLPAGHTDFIFSIIGEELGLLGTITVIVLFLLLIRYGINVIKNAPDTFGFFLSLGLLSMICFKAIINIGVSCGMLPTKGLPLPFISYGGSSFIFDMVCVGILLNVARTGDYP